MPSPRERDYRPPISFARPARGPEQQARPQARPSYRRQHFHDFPPWPQQRHHDYVWAGDRWGWWPRWFPYWDQGWYDYWWYLYDYYGGDGNPDYAEYARDAVLRENAATWGLTVSGHWMGVDPPGPVVRDHRGIVPQHGSPLLPGGGGGIVPSHGSPLPGGGYVTPGGGIVRTPGGIVPSHGSPLPGGGYVSPGGAIVPSHDRPRYHHPHDYYHDYTVVDGAWWPRWFPYWDQAWFQYWWQLYYYYGGDAYADYAQYARDAHLRADAARLGWRIR